MHDIVNICLGYREDFLDPKDGDRITAMACRLASLHLIILVTEKKSFG